MAEALASVSVSSPSLPARPVSVAAEGNGRRIPESERLYRRRDQLRTSSFLLDDDILIDAGTGVEDLTVPELARIDHVFLTHSHLDHICALPLMVDSVGGSRKKPLVVHALQETIDALKAHIFNWVIWPDFTEIPHYDRPWMVFEPLSVGTTVTLGERRIRPIAANHTVPALGFHLSAPGGSIVYSGDTWPNAEFWRTINGIRDLKYLIIENAFSNKEQDLAITAKHLYPIQLSQELASLRVEPEILITHLKPSDRELIAQEIQSWAGRFEPVVLQTGQVL
ncbi:MAG: 3',5'-cyclic-nucleotide phosphodiesterase, partial [Burkholderiaceae bacterium]|nr:3',5'-cyclic-nucleotide phosphodiesterase [Burkholderiaceae bacterium]